MSGAWAIREEDQTESQDVKGLRFEDYVWYPGLPYDQAIAVFVLPDNTAFLSKVTMLSSERKELLYEPDYNQWAEQYRTIDTLH